MLVFNCIYELNTIFSKVRLYGRAAVWCIIFVWFVDFTDSHRFVYANSFILQIFDTLHRVGTCIMSRGYRN